MAQTIIGLDIGSFSVKVSTLSSSFRSFSWTGYREYEIPHTRRDRPERAAAQVLSELGKEVRQPNAVVVCALPGDRAMTRFLSLPFTDTKRIDSVLGFELEGQIPLGVQDMLYSYQVLGTTDAGETELFAAAVKNDTMARYLEGLQEAGIDPRVLTLDTTSYVNLYDHIAPEGTVAFIDIGHRTTKICIVENGRLRQARSLGRGGQEVTEALSDHLDISFEEAELLKHEQGALPGVQGSDPCADVIAQAHAPIVLAIRQTCKAYARTTGNTVQQVYVTGGGSRIENCHDWLEEQVGYPIHTLVLNQLPFNRAGINNETEHSAAKSLGLALHQAAASKHVTTLNFRRGDYSYEGDYKFLREKLKYLSLLASMVVIIAAISAFMKNRHLQQTLDEQHTALAEFTKDTLGKSERSFKAALTKLSAPIGANEGIDYFPPMTAIEVLNRITAVQEQLNRAHQAGAPIRGPGVPNPRAMPNIRGALGQPGGGGRGVSRPGMGAMRPTAGLPQFQPPTARGGMNGPGTERMRPGPPALGPRSDNRQPRIQAGDRVNGPPSHEEGPGEEADESATEESTEEDLGERKKIELTIVNIDVFGDVKVTAETHESNVSGKEDFRQRLAEQPCFTQVARRDIGGVVSTGRHADWVKFEVSFKIRCRQDDSASEEGGNP